MNHKRLKQHITREAAKLKDLRLRRKENPFELSSAMYDCKVFNYSLPSKCINKLLNIIAPLAHRKAFLRFHFVFNNIFVVWNKLKFVHVSLLPRPLVL